MNKPPDSDVVPVRVLLINESPPADPEEMASVYELFRRAGYAVNGMEDLVERGIGFTTALRNVKRVTAVETAEILSDLPALAAEIESYPDLVAIFLCGDVAKKAFNAYARQKTGKPVIPSGATYKIRANTYHFGDIRVFPSYIVTGGNLKIERGKTDMIVEDLIRLGEVAKLQREI